MSCTCVWSGDPGFEAHIPIQWHMEPEPDCPEHAHLVKWEERAPTAAAPSTTYKGLDEISKWGKAFLDTDEEEG